MQPRGSKEQKLFLQLEINSKKPANKEPPSFTHQSNTHGLIIELINKRDQRPGACFVIRVIRDVLLQETLLD
jgi:hypothetical protein